MADYERHVREMDWTYLKKFMDELAAERTPGNAIEVYVDGKNVFRYAAGCSDLERRIPMTGEEYFYIYSATKLTTVTAALQLLEQGKYLLSDPLYFYMPEFRGMTVRKEDGSIVRAENAITIADLFTMTAGFDYDTERKAFAAAKEKTAGRMDTVEVIKALADEPLCFEPGSHWQYSLCHDVLAGLVSVISGQKFRDYTTEHIFKPLGMDHTFWHLTPEIEGKMASQYQYVPNTYDTAEERLWAEKCGTIREGRFENCGKQNFLHLGEEFESGGGGIISTVSDYARLMAALADYGMGLNGERILSRGTVELMRTDRLTAVQRADFNWNEFKGCGYGLGVYTVVDKAKAGSTGSAGEFGWGGAAGATAFADPERKLGVFFAQHCLNPREEYYQPRLKNVIHACLDR